MYNFFKSRKFWLAVLGVVQTLIAHYFEIDAAVWQSIDALIVSVIMGIAIEDAGAKSAGNL